MFTLSTRLNSRNSLVANAIDLHSICSHSDFPFYQLFSVVNTARSPQIFYICAKLMLIEYWLLAKNLTLENWSKLAQIDEITFGSYRLPIYFRFDMTDLFDFQYQSRSLTKVSVCACALYYVCLSVWSGWIIHEWYWFHLLVPISLVSSVDGTLCCLGLNYGGWRKNPKKMRLRRIVEYWE